MCIGKNVSQNALNPFNDFIEMLMGTVNLVKESLAFMCSFEETNL